MGTFIQLQKIHVVNDFLQNTEYDILVFLDSDAWIKNGNWLSELLDNLINNENKHGCFQETRILKKIRLLIVVHL